MPGERTESLCVFCRRHAAQDPWRPFCSERCRLQDLARWADGTYRVPSHTREEDTDADTNDEDADDGS